MSSPLIQPYLMFGGRCEEALEFYRTALGAQIDMLMRYQDSPEAPPPGVLPPGFENKVMHASFRVGGTVLMASDGCEQGQAFKGFSLSISVTEEAEAKRFFPRLPMAGPCKCRWRKLSGHHASACSPIVSASAG